MFETRVMLTQQPGALTIPTVHAHCTCNPSDRVLGPHCRSLSLHYKIHQLPVETNITHTLLLGLLITGYADKAPWFKHVQTPTRATCMQPVSTSKTLPNHYCQFFLTLGTHRLPNPCARLLAAASNPRFVLDSCVRWCDYRH